MQSDDLHVKGTGRGLGALHQEGYSKTMSVWRQAKALGGLGSRDVQRTMLAASAAPWTLHASTGRSRS